MIGRRLILMAAKVCAIAWISLVSQWEAMAEEPSEVVAALVEMIEMDRELAHRLVVEHRDDADGESLREAADALIAADQAALKECLYGRYNLDARMQLDAGEEVVFPEEFVYDKFGRNDPDGGVTVAKAPAPGLPILPAGYSVLMGVGINWEIDSARVNESGDLQSNLLMTILTYRGRNYPVDREKLPQGAVYNHWWTPVFHTTRLPLALRSPDGKPVLLASPASGDDPERRSLLIFVTTWIVN